MLIHTWQYLSLCDEEGGERQKKALAPFFLPQPQVGVDWFFSLRLGKSIPKNLAHTLLK